MCFYLQYEEVGVQYVPGPNSGCMGTPNPQKLCNVTRQLYSAFTLADLISLFIIVYICSFYVLVNKMCWEGTRKLLVVKQKLLICE